MAESHLHATIVRCSAGACTLWALALALALCLQPRTFPLVSFVRLPGGGFLAARDSCVAGRSPSPAARRARPAMHAGRGGACSTGEPSVHAFGPAAAVLRARRRSMYTYTYTYTYTHVAVWRLARGLGRAGVVHARRPVSQSTNATVPSGFAVCVCSMFAKTNRVLPT